jgi:Putative DNA-binding domain
MLPLEEELSSYAARFATALNDPVRATPSLVAGPKGKVAVRRYNVYRNNVTVSLIDALAAVYPAVQRITGVEFFRAMARFHVRATPPTSPLLFDYGRDFPPFIETYEYARTMPWLADVARIERAWLDAYHAADVAPLSTDALALVPPERLADVVFTAHPAARIVRSSFAAVTIFAANRGEGASGQIDAGTPEDALITRPEMDVVVRQLPEGRAVFLTGLMSGQTLGVAATSARQSSASFDIAANIAGMIEAGAFTSISFGEA